MDRPEPRLCTGWAEREGSSEQRWVTISGVERIALREALKGLMQWCQLGRQMESPRSTVDCLASEQAPARGRAVRPLSVPLRGFGQGHRDVGVGAGRPPGWVEAQDGGKAVRSSRTWDGARSASTRSAT
jgi:hypothetical protein